VPPDIIDNIVRSGTGGFIHQNRAIERIERFHDSVL